MNRGISALVDTVYFARSEAVKWGGNIRVSKYKPAGCTADDGTAADWSCGWQVEFVTAPSPLPAGWPCSITQRATAYSFSPNRSPPPAELTWSMVPQSLFGTSTATVPLMVSAILSTRVLRT